MALDLLPGGLFSRNPRAGQPPLLDVARLYERFDLPLAGLDCGAYCAPHNPSGKPFCCDICQAVPAAYPAEWETLRGRTDLWHAWRGDECPGDPAAADPRADLPEGMLLLACKGPAHCEREHRALSCRQFPFFPYISADDRFLGLAYEWEYEPICWVISHLEVVSAAYRQAFIEVFDALLAAWPEAHESYALHSEDMRARFAARHRRIPLLHRNGGLYLLSPASERLAHADHRRLPRFGPYRVAGV